MNTCTTRRFPWSVFFVTAGRKPPMLLQPGGKGVRTLFGGMDEIGGTAAEPGKHVAPTWPPAKDVRGRQKRVLTPFLLGVNSRSQFPIHTLRLIWHPRAGGVRRPRGACARHPPIGGVPVSRRRSMRSVRTDRTEHCAANCPNAGNPIVYGFAGPPICVARGQLRRFDEGPSLVRGCSSPVAAN